MSNPLPSGYKPGLFGKVALWVLGHRKLTAASILLIAITSVFIGIPPKVDSDMLTMLPPDKPVIAATKKLNKEEGGVAFLLLAFNSLDENAEAEVMTRYMKDLEARVKEVEGVDYAIHDVDPDLALKLGLLNLEMKDVDQLSKRLQGALALGPVLNPMVLGPLLDMGPVSERMSAAQEMSFLASTSTHGRLLIRPTGSPSDQKFTWQFMEDIERVIDEF
jgi:predicted RND superfamily exporter protein